MSLGVHGIHHLFHHTIGVNHHCDPAGTGFIRTTARSKSHSQNAICVTQKREIEIKLLSKSSIVFDRIKAHSKDFDLLVAIDVFSVAKLATFNRSARGVGFRVKPEQYTAAP